MSRGPQTFRKGDLIKIAEAMAEAGVKGWRAEITQGKITVIAGEPDKASPAVPVTDDLDQELADFEARHAG